MFVAFASVFDASRRLLAWLPLSIGLSFALPCAASPAHQQPVNNAKARKHTPAPKAAAKSHKSHRTQAHAAKATAADSYASRTDVMQWAHEAATRLDLPTDWVRQQIGQARRIPRWVSSVAVGRGSCGIDYRLGPSSDATRTLGSTCSGCCRLGNARWAQCVRSHNRQVTPTGTIAASFFQSTPSE